MQVQAINNNDQTFGATLKVRNRSAISNMERPVINFLEREFPKRTKDIKGHLDLSVGVSLDSALITKLKYSNGKHKRYKDYIDIIELPKQKEKLLNSLVNSLEGFIIRENAKKEIKRLKNEIINVSDRAFCDSSKIFQQQFKCCSLINVENEIIPKGYPVDTKISR